jgi:hypothetical protein
MIDETTQNESVADFFHIFSHSYKRNKKQDDDDDDDRSNNRRQKLLFSSFNYIEIHHVLLVID